MLLVIFIFALLFFLSRENFEENKKQPLSNQTISREFKNVSMKISSPVFSNNEKIPSKYTCDGENINPPLEFFEIPEGTKSLALIVDDPDVPKNIREDGLWVHWVLWNIPPNVREIPESVDISSGTRASEATLFGAIEGENTSRGRGYTGPCPPDREHRYFFKLYALDIMVPSEFVWKDPNTDFEKAMEGHILEKAELIGRYERIE